MQNKRNVDSATPHESLMVDPFTYLCLPCCNVVDGKVLAECVYMLSLLPRDVASKWRSHILRDAVVSIQSSQAANKYQSNLSSLKCNYQTFLSPVTLLIYFNSKVVRLV